jgi:hypothetical protein
MVFNTTFNSISVLLWQSVLLEKETGVSGENDRPVTSDYNVVSSTPHQELTLGVIGTDYIGSCK